MSLVGHSATRKENEMSQFTTQELDLLIEAVGEWDRHKTGHGGGPLAAMLEGMAIPVHCSDPNCETCQGMRAEFERVVKTKRDEAKIASERSILLRAKLIGLRDSQAADKLFDQAGKARE